MAADFLNFSTMQYISFNTDYVLKPDNGKALIMSAFVGRNSQKGITDSFTNIIHPIYAMILSFVDGREKNECIEDAADALDVPKGLIEKFVDTVCENEESIYIKSKDGISAFPPHTIVKSANHKHNNRYNADIFHYEDVKLEMSRHLTPSSITFMFNNICKTDCIYCYQDKSRKVGCSIPLNRIIELIHEAHKLHVTTIDVIGGEFFLYNNWKDVLTELRKFGYNPYLSTKLALEEDDIKFLAEIKIHDIQISLDSLIEEHLKQPLKISTGYVEKIKKSLTLLDKYHIPIMIHTVLTKYNDSTEDMLSIYEYIKHLESLVDWHVVKAEPTLYPKTDYKNIEISRAGMDNISDFLEDLNNKNEIKIYHPTKSRVVDVSDDTINGSKPATNNFFQRSLCSGLYSTLYILPDGWVTMCEQLYWNKQFIIGSILNQSLAEIWNSEKAKSIFYIKQENIPNDSRCHLCNEFNICRSVRQVCYRDIIRKYGKDKWYYPDTKCPYVNN